MNASLTPSLQQAQARWQSLAPRERAALLLALAVLALALFWWLLLSPALQTLRQADAQHAVLDAQLQRMRGLQAEAQALQASPPLPAAEAQRALEAAVRQHLGASAQLRATGDRATVTLKGVAPDALAQWLAQARVNAHALPIEAHLARAAEAAARPDGRSDAKAEVRWDGTVVLRLP